MRLKGRWVPDKQPKIIEIDCGMGMKELRAEIREIQAITMLPKCMLRQEPAWKKPVIIASLLAAGLLMSLSFMLFTMSPVLFGALMIVGFGWIAFVAFANRERRR